MSERASCSRRDDDVGFQRAMREQQDQINKERDVCRPHIANRRGCRTGGLGA